MLKWRTRDIRAFLSCEKGTTVIEYGLIATTVGIAVVVAFPKLTSTTSGIFATVLQNVETVMK